MLVANDDIGSRPLSLELWSNAEEWGQKLEVILRSEAEKSLSTAEGLANKAMQFSTKASENVSSMFVRNKLYRIV